MGLVRLPKRQGFRTFLLVLLLAVFMGYLAVLYTGLVSGTKTIVIGAAAGIGVLLAAGILTQVFVVLVWLISKLPSMGRLSVRMAFRSMGTQKRRLGSTLLALSIGILSIGSIAILAQNIKHELGSTIEQRQSFNVVVQSPHDPAAQSRVAATVAGLPGIQSRANGAIANQLTLASVDGQPVKALINRTLALKTKDGSHKFTKDAVSQAVSNMRAVIARDVQAVSGKYIMDKGRNLDSRDAGTNHIVVSQDIADPFGIKLGSHVVYAEPGRRVSFTVVGIPASTNFMVMAESETDLQYLQRVGLTAPSGSHNALTFLEVRHADVSADVAKLRRALHGSLVLDLSSFLEFTQIIDKLALFPEIIGGLALFAGVIIIANTVALAMLERRREIGVMKAVGAKRRSILRFLFVENAIVGFLGAGVGVLLSVIAAAIVDQQMLKISPSFDWLTIVALIALGMVLAIGASALTALPASNEKPLRVLRYE